MTGFTKYIPPHLRDQRGQKVEAPAYLSEVEADLWRHSSDYKHLLALKPELAGKPDVDRQFQHNRKLSFESTPGDKLCLHFLSQFSNAMGEIIDSTEDVLLRVKHFLDIGCAPGGYSKRLLEKNPEAQGTGFTLAYGEGGTAMASDCWSDQVSARFALIEGDIMDSSAHRKVQRRGKFDLVIAGATYRNPCTSTPEGQGPGFTFQEFPVAQTQLYLQQLVLALETLAEGGTLVATLSMKGTASIAILLCLRSLFKSIVAVKTRLQCIRSRFNIVCSGFCGDATSAVQKLTLAMVDAESNANISRDLQKNALWHQVCPAKSVLDDDERTFVLGLLEPLWRVQAQAIRERLEKWNVNLARRQERQYPRLRYPAVTCAEFGLG